MLYTVNYQLKKLSVSIIVLKRDCYIIFINDLFVYFLHFKYIVVIIHLIFLHSDWIFLLYICILFVYIISLRCFYVSLLFIVSSRWLSRYILYGAMNGFRSCPNQTERTISSPIFPSHCPSAGEAVALPSLLLPRRWRPPGDPRSGDQSRGHPDAPPEALRRHPQRDLRRRRTRHHRDEVAWRRGRQSAPERTGVRRRRGRSRSRSLVV